MEEEGRDRTEASTLGSLLSSLTHELTTLVRNEIQLAKAEISENASQAAKGGAFIAMAGAVLFSGFLVLLAAAVYGLNTMLSPNAAPWLSALIVGVIVLIIGAIMLQAGRKKLTAENLAPNRTVASVKSDKEFVKQHDVKAKEQMK